MTSVDANMYLYFKIPKTATYEVVSTVKESILVTGIVFVVKESALNELYKT